IHGEVISVQSPYLIRALTENILNGYPGISHETSKLEFRAPFQPILHRWGDLLKLIMRDNLDGTTKAHMAILHQILERELLGTVTAFQQHILSRDITFDHAWMIFQPGCIVVSSAGPGLAAFELERAEYTENQLGKFLRLHCECIDWHGAQYCRRISKIDLSEFEGTKEIKSLQTFPIEFSDDKEQIKSQLEKQGEDFESFNYHRFKWYSGSARGWDDSGRKQEIHLSGHIIIDPKSFDQFSPYYSGQWKQLSHRDYDMLITSRATQAAMRKLRVNVSDGPVITLSSFHHTICSTRVRGYSIKLKRWLEFCVSDITEIPRNPSAIENLPFWESLGTLISNFAEARPKTEQGLWTSDQIANIDMSIHILGHESALKGVTAEAVAERIGIPLLTISRDDLGSTMLQTEVRLYELLQHVQQWHTLVVLEGLDFLAEKRSTYDYGLHDVLHILVYNLKDTYKGPFFISTNR
ncbi:hypothetical protein GQ53DRAFT_629247, partial [Thozetella sp. PMI_491]